MRVGYSLAALDSLIFLSSVVVGRPIYPHDISTRETPTGYGLDMKSDSLAGSDPAIVTLTNRVSESGNTDTQNDDVSVVCLDVVDTASGPQPLAYFCPGAVVPVPPSGPSSSSPSGGETQVSTTSATLGGGNSAGAFAPTQTPPLSTTQVPSSSNTADADPPVITSHEPEPAPARVSTTSKRYESKPFPPYGLRPGTSSTTPSETSNTLQESQTPSITPAFYPIPASATPASPSPTDELTTTENIQQTTTETVAMPSSTPTPTADPDPSSSSSFPTSSTSAVPALPNHRTPSVPDPSGTTASTSRPTTSPGPDNSGGIDIIPISQEQH